MSREFVSMNPEFVQKLEEAFGEDCKVDKYSLGDPDWPSEDDEEYISCVEIKDTHFHFYVKQMQTSNDAIELYVNTHVWTSDDLVRLGDRVFTGFTGFDGDKKTGTEIDRLIKFIKTVKEDTRFPMQ